MSGEVNASEGTRLEEVLAVSFGKRLITAILDGVFVFFITMMVVFAISFVLIFIGMYVDDQDAPINGLMAIVGIGVALFYFIGSWSKSGQTLAKSCWIPGRRKRRQALNHGQGSRPLSWLYCQRCIGIPGLPVGGL